MPNYFALTMNLWWEISMVFIFKSSNIINLACNFCNILFFKQRKFSHLANSPACLFGCFLWLFLAAGGWINSILEGDINL
jgi:hypothetical protein